MKLTEQDIKWYYEYGGKVLDYSVSNDMLFHNHIGASELYLLFEDGFLDLFNVPNSPWQKGFWKWMEKMKYGRAANDDFSITYYLWHDGEEIYSPKPQMLTGYILEYLKTDRK